MSNYTATAAACANIAFTKWTIGYNHYNREDHPFNPTTEYHHLYTIRVPGQ